MKLDLLSDARWLPYGVDWKAGRLLFLPTEPQRLRDASFIDGREDFSTGPGAALPLETALAWTEAETPPEPNRLLLHLSFCGSTLLANLLDQPGQVLSLKEPNVLVDLSQWKAALLAEGSEDARFRPTLALVLRLLRRPITDGERIMVKPSNWANNLIPDLIELGSIRPAFIGIDRRRFVATVFRGNRDRAVYTARALSHLATGRSDWQTHVAAAIAASAEPLDRMARLALLAHRLQTELFEATIAAADLDRAAVRLDFAEIVEQPAAAAARAASQLAITVPTIRPEVLERDVKSQGRTYRAAEHRQYDDAIERSHGDRFDAAIEWIDRRFS